jgi:hypothetical protein
VPEFADEAGGAVLAGKLAGDLLGVAPVVRGVRGGGEPTGGQPGSRDGVRPGAECPETGGPEGLADPYRDILARILSGLLAPGKPSA